MRSFEGVAKVKKMRQQKESISVRKITEGDIIIQVSEFIRRQF